MDIKLYEDIHKMLGLGTLSVISSIDMNVILILYNYYNQIPGLRKIEKNDVLKIIDWTLSHDGTYIKEEKLREVRKEFE